MHNAVLLSGRLLFFKEHYDNIVKTFGPNIDFFLSTDPSLDENIEEFIKLYKPIAVNNKPITELNVYKPYYDKFLTMFPKAIVYRNSDNMSKNFINKRRVVELLKKHIEATGATYDYICITRLDIFYNSSIDWSHINPLENTIFVPEGHDYNGLNERLCIGNLDTIDKYSSIYNNSLKIIESTFERNNNIIFPEILLNAHINDLKVNIKRFPLTNYIMRLAQVEPKHDLIMNTRVYNKNIKYTSLTKSIALSINTDEDTIRFNKIINKKKWFSWFGYKLEPGTYTLTFDIISNKDIDYHFIKRHNSNDYFTTNKIKADCLETISLDITVDPSDLKILFIFDELEDYIDIIFRNISFTKKMVNTIHIVLFAYGEPFESVKEKMINTVCNFSKNKIKIHDYTLEKIKTREWFKQIEVLPNIHKPGRRDGYYCAYKIFCVNEVYEKLEKNDVLFYLDSSQYYKDGFTESIDRLCSIALEKGIIAGSIGNNI